MKARHIASGSALAASLVLAVIGWVTGAAVLVALASIIELLAAMFVGKKTNT